MRSKKAVTELAGLAQPGDEKERGSFALLSLVTGNPFRSVPVVIEPTTVHTATAAGSAATRGPCRTLAEPPRRRSHREHGRQIHRRAPAAAIGRPKPAREPVSPKPHRHLAHGRHPRAAGVRATQSHGGAAAAARHQSQDGGAGRARARGRPIPPGRRPPPRAVHGHAAGLPPSRTTIFSLTPALRARPAIWKDRSGCSDRVLADLFGLHFDEAETTAQPCHESVAILTATAGASGARAVLVPQAWSNRERPLATKSLRDLIGRSQQNHACGSENKSNEKGMPRVSSRAQIA